ncbi:ParB N-terminal domain-containing protein [Glutamicibacter sp.]|uniref:ParB/RepB/Spo0J family partition protein n=1 Tax=Glutamicibacter sp. TaxID=1931995 RepID=UPI0028BD846C|nr:ParB N-terminal domain-containing protein [Glutamicibacter sp.]
MSQKPGELRMVPTTAIHPDPLNPRTDMGDIDQLAHELKTLGQMDAITIYPHPDLAGDFMIQGGHRRHAAALRAGLDQMKCEIVESPSNASLDLYTEALSTGTNHLPLDYLGQSKALQGMLTEGKSESWIAKNFNIDKAEVKPRAALANQPKVAQLQAAGKIDLFAAKDIIDLEAETGADLFSDVVDEVANSWQRTVGQEEVTRLIEQKKANAKRQKVRQDLTEADAVELDETNRYSGKWAKSGKIASVEEHIAAGHQFDVGDPDAVQWWEKLPASATKKQVSPEEKARREKLRRLDSVLPISQRARHAFVLKKIQDKKAIEDRNARGLLVSMIFDQAVRGYNFDGAEVIGEAVSIPFPEPDGDESIYGPEFEGKRKKWEERARKAALGLTTQQLALLLAYAPIADSDRKLVKTNWYMRDSYDKESRWKPLAFWYQQLIDFVGYVPSEDEAEIIRLAEETSERPGNNVHLNTATCQNCMQEVVKDTKWTGICAECAPAIEGIELN